METLRLACERLGVVCPGETMVQMFLVCSSFGTRAELIAIVENAVGLRASALHPAEIEDLWTYAAAFRTTTTKEEE